MADFVIVGGGVYGVGAAWELAKRGAEVHLLEAKTIAGGASGGLGKRGVRANGRDLRELPLMRLAYDIWPTLHQEIGASTGFERTGHLLLIEREQDYAAAEAQAWTQRQQDIPTRLVGREELREMEPHLSERIMAALYCPKDGIADHTATTRGLARAAGNLGVHIQVETAVVGMERQGERVTALLTQQEERIPVEHTVLLLSNSHVPTFVQQNLNLTVPVWASLPQVILTGPIDPPPLYHLIGHAHRTLALKAASNSQVMISGGWRGRWNPDTKQGETLPDQVEGNRLEAAAVYPGLAGIPLAQTAADRRETISIDHIPIIDRLPGADNMIIATGWSGHGWAIAPALIKLLAEWAFSGNQSDTLRPFSYRRFSRY